LFVIVVLADLAARMSLTKLALACSAADELWVLAAATIAFRSDSARVAPAVSVLKTAARCDGGFSVSSWLRWSQRAGWSGVRDACLLSKKKRTRSSGRGRITTLAHMGGRFAVMMMVAVTTLGRVAFGLFGILAAIGIAIYGLIAANKPSMARPSWAKPLPPWAIRVAYLAAALLMLVIAVRGALAPGGP
jgi:hypothetical protein